MKKLFIALSVFMILLSGCKSKTETTDSTPVDTRTNEEKADELIKDEMFKTLYDFESYEPIETVVKEATISAYTDTTCWRIANEIFYAYDKSKKYIKEAKQAEQYMNIWGEPNYYSSSYSDRQYYKYREEYIEKLGKSVEYLAIIKEKGLAMRDSLNCYAPRYNRWVGGKS